MSFLVFLQVETGISAKIILEVCFTITLTLTAVSAKNLCSLMHCKNLPPSLLEPLTDDVLPQF